MNNAKFAIKVIHPVRGSKIHIDLKKDIKRKRFTPLDAQRLTGRAPYARA